MEGELVVNFFISETKRDFDQVQQNHFNSFKKLADFQNLKGVAQKLSPPHPQSEVLSCRVKIALKLITKKIWSGSLAYKSTLEKQYFIVSEPKVEVISSKIDRLAAIYTSKFKWAWRAQFFSRTLQILETNQFFEAVKMVLLYLVNISFSF